MAMLTPKNVIKECERRIVNSWRENGLPSITLWEKSNVYGPPTTSVFVENFGIKISNKATRLVEKMDSLVFSLTTSNSL